jgi:hypothetical protein
MAALQPGEGLSFDRVSEALRRRRLQKRLLEKAACQCKFGLETTGGLCQHKPIPRTVLQHASLHLNKAEFVRSLHKRPPMVRTRRVRKAGKSSKTARRQRKQSQARLLQGGTQKMKSSRRSRPRPSTTTVRAQVAQIMQPMRGLLPDYKQAWELLGPHSKTPANQSITRAGQSSNTEITLTGDTDSGFHPAPRITAHASTQGGQEDTHVGNPDWREFKMSEEMGNITGFGPVLMQSLHDYVKADGKRLQVLTKAQRSDAKTPNRLLRESGVSMDFVYAHHLPKKAEAYQDTVRPNTVHNSRLSSRRTGRSSISSSSSSSSSSRRGRRTPSRGKSRTAAVAVSAIVQGPLGSAWQQLKGQQQARPQQHKGLPYRIRGTTPRGLGSTYVDGFGAVYVPTRPRTSRVHRPQLAQEQGVLFNAEQGEVLEALTRFHPHASRLQNTWAPKTLITTPR